MKRIRHSKKMPRRNKHKVWHDFLHSIAHLFLTFYILACFSSCHLAYSLYKLFFNKLIQVFCDNAWPFGKHAACFDIVDFLWKCLPGNNKMKSFIFLKIFFFLFYTTK